LKSLGSYLEHQEVRSAQNGVVEGAGHNGGRPPALSIGVTSEDWLLDWGSPLDVLECTRAEIFNEVLRMRDDERQRIGQELHDSAGQLLLSLQLDVARLRETEKNGRYESLISEIEATARLIGQEIRSLGFLNHPIRLDPAGLVSALQALIAGFGKRTGYRVSFKVVGDQPLPDRTTSMTLLRVAQEALVNIHRHAHASSVTAQLERRGNNLELAIADNGIGIPSRRELATNGGVGVQGMQFRVEQLGGRFRIAKLKHGTKISASVPLAA
jgi:two-component system, NarL family, sensor kinase